MKEVVLTNKEFNGYTLFFKWACNNLKADIWLKLRNNSFKLNELNDLEITFEDYRGLLMAK